MLNISSKNSDGCGIDARTRSIKFITNLFKRKKPEETSNDMDKGSQPVARVPSTLSVRDILVSAYPSSPALSTPARARDIDSDMEALRISRHDNPFLKQVLASRESLADSLEESESDDTNLMSQEFLSELDTDPLSLPEVHEHMIRSPPPTSWPRSPNFKMFRFPEDGTTHDGIGRKSPLSRSVSPRQESKQESVHEEVFSRSLLSPRNFPSRPHQRSSSDIRDDVTEVAIVEGPHVALKNSQQKTSRMKPGRTSKSERKKILKQNSTDASYETILRDQEPQETMNDSFKLKQERNYMRSQHKLEAKCEFSQKNKLLHPIEKPRGDCVGAGDSICDISEEHRIGNKLSGFTQSLRQPSYLQPTLSYRLKCVDKSKSEHGDGNQKIPFVVGNFRSKSHNVGSQIQETLSLIKGAPKQLLEKTREGKDELGNMIRCMTAFQPPLVRSQGKIKPPRSAFMQCSRSTVSMDDRTEPRYIKHHQFRTVLMKLQDEYARLNEKYQKLCKLAQDHASKGSAQNALHACGPDVALQVQNLKEDLNAKEIEINAFVSLYNEVIHLKKNLSKMKVDSDGNDESMQPTTSGRCKTSANRSKKK